MDHFVASGFTEVDVDIGHGDTFWVEETLEEQAVFDRIDVGDAGAKSDEGARSRPTSRADGDIVIFGPVDKVRDDQEIVGKAHFLDHLEFVFEAIEVFFAQIVVLFGWVLGENNLESGLESFEAIGAQGVHIGDAVAFVEFGEVVILVFEVDIAHLGDLEGVFAGIGPFFEEFPHLVGAFEIELLDIVFEAIGIADGFARLDGEEGVLGFGVFAGHVVDIVGGDQSESKLTGDLDELGIDGHLFCDAVHLEFDVIVAVEDLGVFFGGGEGFFVASFEQKLADFTREARRRADQAFGVLAEDIFVDARAVMEAFKKARCHEFREVAITCVVSGEDELVVVDAISESAFFFAKAGHRSQIGFAAHDRFDACAGGLFEKVDGSEHIAVIGDSDSIHAEGLELVK